MLLEILHALGAGDHRRDLAAFAVAIFGMGFVQQQFFPNSDRPELIVDLEPAANASIADTDAQMARFEREMLAGDEGVATLVGYVGQGALRFVLSFDVQPPMCFSARTVILTKSIEDRDRLRWKISGLVAHGLPGNDALVHLLDIGPPVGRPVQYSRRGPEVEKVRDYSRQLGNIVAKTRISAW